MGLTGVVDSRNLPRMQLRQSIPSSEDSNEAPIVVNLGKAKRKQIKRMKKGKGRLMEEIQLTLEEFKRDQAADGRDVVPIVFVVREKREKARGWTS